MIRIAPIVLLLASPLAACVDGEDPTTLDTGAASLTIGGCSPAALDRCDYQPAATYAPAQPRVRTLQYRDVTGDLRSFDVAVRAPIGAPEPMPVVVWSHGGNNGVSNPLNVGEQWAAAFVEAGYVVVDIAHPGRGAVSEQRLCNQLGIGPIDCLRFKPLSWDRPHDAARVFDAIEAAALGPLAGHIDPARIVYAGHSAGAGSVDMINGATRDFGGVQTSLEDPRPIAFIANSPEPPGDDGFIDASFATALRPTLVNTGVGDDTSVVIGEDRTRVFDLMPAGDKYRLYVLDEAARHSTFDHHDDDCQRYSTGHGLDPARCGDYTAWLESSSLAFLDAYARGSLPARAYLASDNLAVLAGGAATWSRK